MLEFDPRELSFWRRLGRVVFVAAGLNLLAGGAAGAVESSDARDHWSFQPVERPAVPKAENDAWSRNPIDAFILARLNEAGVSPSPEADRRTLIRRLSLDLLGLPPTPAEVEFFLQDSRPDAYEQLVDRLLSSPHFGERWARHWLDLARYADSDGYEKDSIRPYAYLYRDWVVDAINRDLPFDRFSIEQLAGDLLPEATLAQKVATGFHRNTLTNREGGVDQGEFRSKANVDRASTTGVVWLGLTVGCAECHSHKYDPISQEEFYQFFAFFDRSVEAEISAPTPDETRKHAIEIEAWRRQGGELEARLRAARAAASGESANAVDALEKAIAEHDKNPPEPTSRRASVLVENEDPPTTHVHIRGDFLRPGKPVLPGTPAVLHPLRARGKTPDRLDLARWLFEPENPLTGRVSVNRIWGHLFGRPLAQSAGDFGARGERPSHPELLDWLASEYPRLGWRRKELIRLITASAVYRQSSNHRPELETIDPDNRLLARQNRLRLGAEGVRDVFLAASGLLSPRVGGPGARPPLPDDIAALGYANSVKWKESEGAQKYRRGLYIVFQRTVPYPMLVTFDAPDSNSTCVRRERSNTPLQALTLLNDPVFFECAQVLGRRMALEVPNSPAARIDRLFERCLARPPSDAERARLETLLEAHRQLLKDEPERARQIAGLEGGPRYSPKELVEFAIWTAMARTVMNLDEFFTRP